MNKTILYAACLFLPPPVTAGITIEWDFTAAEAVLGALSVESVDAEALAGTAALQGNRALIEKVAWAKPKTDADLFIESINQARNGNQWKDDPFYFWQLMPYREEMKARLSDLSEQRAELDRRLAASLSALLPEDFELTTTVYVVIGGPSAGWTSGDGNLYLSLPHYMRDPVQTMERAAAHEIFHVAQENIMAYTGSSLENRQHANAENLLIALAREGTARLLDDPLAIEAEGKMLGRDREKERRNRDRMASAFVMFENLVFRVFHDPDADTKAIYAAGFFDDWDTFAYSVGLYMAQAIVAADGEDGLVALMRRPPVEFVRRYIAISRDTPHPQFSPGFVKVIEALP